MSQACSESNHTSCPDASEVFLKHLTSEINKEDVYKMIEAQQHMLSRFEKTNEMLLNFNGLSNARYETTQKEFRRHIQLLVDSKKDLESIFRRIRLLKSKLSVQYPVAFAACAQAYHVPDDDDYEEDGRGSSGVHDSRNKNDDDLPRSNIQDTTECSKTQSTRDTLTISNQSAASEVQTDSAGDENNK